jgi:NAD(P)H-flavin reductase
MLPTLYRIQHVWQEMLDTFTLELAPVDGGPMPAFAAGQFNMLYVFGAGEIPISMSGDPTKPGPYVHTIRATGSVSRALQALKRGDVLGVRGPFGRPWPLEQAVDRDLIIAAGGIGLAPLRSTLYQVFAQRASYRRVIVLYGARTPADILYAHELEHWQGRLDLDVYVTVDRALREWRGRVGVVTRLISRVLLDPANTTAFICGPEIMMRFAAAELTTHGVPAEQTFVSLERNMKCAIGFCGHCQYQPYFVCRDGPIFQYSQVRHLLMQKEI